MWDKFGRDILIGVLIGLWAASVWLTWYITSINVKPEVRVVTLEKTVYRLQKDIEVQKIKEDEQFLFKVPFTDWGLTKQFTIGYISGATTVLVVF